MWVRRGYMAPEAKFSRCFAGFTPLIHPMFFCAEHETQVEDRGLLFKPGTHLPAICHRPPTDSTYLWRVHSGHHTRRLPANPWLSTALCPGWTIPGTALGEQQARQAAPRLSWLQRVRCSGTAEGFNTQGWLKRDVAGEKSLMHPKRLPVWQKLGSKALPRCVLVALCR